jgi:uncharacterized membrane protein
MLNAVEVNRHKHRGVSSLTNSSLMSMVFIVAAYSITPPIPDPNGFTVTTGNAGILNE